MPQRNHQKKPKPQAASETERFDDALLEPKSKQSGVGGMVVEKADQATEAIGAGMESLGESLREHTPDHGVLGNAGGAIAEKLQSGGRYLESHGLSGIGADLTNLVRRNPLTALLIGAGIGFCLARMMRR